MGDATILILFLHGWEYTHTLPANANAAKWPWHPTQQACTRNLRVPDFPEKNGCNDWQTVTQATIYIIMPRGAKSKAAVLVVAIIAVENAENID
jgi:hypothetical protein